MVQSDRLKVGPSIGDIDRGLEHGTPKRELYQELSKIANVSRSADNETSKKVFEKLKEVADKIHSEGK